MRAERSALESGSDRRLEILLAAFSGTLLALSFPRFGYPGLGWIALAPLLIALAGTRLWRIVCR